MFKKFVPVLILSVVCLFGCKDTTTQPQPIALEELTIANIHEAYQNGTYTSEALIHTYLKAIDSQNANINAITTINANAIAQAKALDEEYKKTKVLRPLHGIPMIVKDNINTIGLPTTAGALALKDFIPEDDAFIIKQLKDAGAIILAKSNMAEWAFSAMHTKSSTGGTTRNPYNLEHVPAGSSGGTAAAIASNIGVIGLGTDTGNSIRGPSSHCALVGFRTTLGLISREGIAPLFLRNDVVGPMCRTVEDAARVMEVMAGYDTNDPITKNSHGQIPDNYTQFLDANGLKGARIGVLRELSDNNIDNDIEALFNTALTDLSALGATVIDPVVINDFKSLSQDQWCAKFREDIEAYLARYVKRDTMKTLEDIIRVGTSSEFANRRLNQYTTAGGRWGTSDAECLDAYHDQRRIAFREAIEQVMDSLKLDAIVYPTWNYKPARIDRFEEDYKGDNNQIIAPHTGQPAFTVPMGMSPGNLPVGIQFLGRMFDEPTLVKLAYAYEQGTKHRTTPPKTY